jgi:hypothetical protein
VVVNDFNVFGSMTGPAKADSPLVIDPDAVLPLSVAPQALQSIAGRHTQVIEAGGDLELPQLATGHDGDALEAPDALSLCEGFGVGTPKRSDHAR